MSEFLQHVVDLNIQLVGAEQRSPSLKYGVCHLKNADVGYDVIGGQPRNEVLDIAGHTVSLSRSGTFSKKASTGDG